MVDPEKYLFNDVDAATAKKWTSTLTAAPVMNSPLTHNPYDVLPCAYLVLEKDLTLPKEYQERMAASRVNHSRFTVRPAATRRTLVGQMSSL